jgi:hypothetical protein
LNGESVIFVQNATQPERDETELDGKLRRGMEIDVVGTYRNTFSVETIVDSGIYLAPAIEET